MEDIQKLIQSYGAESIRDGIVTYIGNQIRIKAKNSIAKFDDDPQKVRYLAGVAKGFVKIIMELFHLEEAMAYKPGVRPVTYQGLLKELGKLEKERLNAKTPEEALAASEKAGNVLKQIIDMQSKLAAAN